MIMHDPRTAKPILSVAEMRERESGSGIDPAELMERAGRGVVAAVRHERPDILSAGQTALILCGPGNNGGDGYVVARLLADAGLDVTVLAYGDPGALPDPAAQAHRAWVAAGGRVAPLLDHQPDWDRPPPALLVDALFGGGLDRPMPDDLSEALVTIDDRAAYALSYRVAIDAPSGLNLDTGRVMFATGRECIVLEFDLTVTFDALRPGHLLASGPTLCGKVVVAELGIAALAWGKTFTIPVPSDFDPVLGSGEAPNKYDHGHVLVLAGGPGRGGAARLAARGALRVGAGLVTVACPSQALTENAARLDAIMLRTVDGADDLRALLTDARINVLVLGPGLGLDRARELVPVALASGRACVLDADALTAFADDPAALFAQLHKNVVLTPHGGEFARLFPDLADHPSVIEAAREAGRRCNATVVLKGPVTVISGGGTAHVLATGTDPRTPAIPGIPWLATAGSGDVLAGMIAGLIARGGRAWTSPGKAVWLHAEAARRFGRGLIAEDLPDLLPAVFRDL